MSNVSIAELAKHRLDKAAAMLKSAHRDYNAEDYASANNRAYYCIFHSMRAVLALDNADFKKHSGVISYFTLHYLKTEIFPKDFGGLISTASMIRNNSDYSDFYECSAETTEKLIEEAERFYYAITEYVMLQI